MQKNKIRADKTCLNCSATNVEDRFCPKCGQENIDSHLSFRELFYHFIEDLTHYDNAFWKTIKYLLFHPARLTKEYLSGKRKLFVPPIKLYFFISFITFLIPTLLPNSVDENQGKPLLKTEKSIETDSLKKKDFGVTLFGSRRYKSIKELDSLQKVLPDEQKLGALKYKIIKAILNAKSGKNSDDYSEKFNEGFTHNLSKAIFIYLPIFGFWLWLFHDKKKWFFFDHAIFTLHYFGFLLLAMTLSISVLEPIMDLFPLGNFHDIISSINGIITCTWVIVYFYIAHKKMYNEKMVFSLIKSTLLVIINLVLIAAIMVGLAIYSLINIH